MIIAKLAAYALAIFVILGLSVKLMWLFFILFMYRTYSSFISFEWFQHIGINNHLIYFVIILVLSIATYLLMLRLTVDLTWVRFVVLALLSLWVFKHYTFSDIFLLKDYLQSKGMWNIGWYTNQIKEIFSTGPDGFSKLFSSIFNDVFGIFQKVIDGISNLVK